MRKISYASVEEIRQQMGKQGEDGTGADEALTLIAEGMSQALDNHFNKPDGFVVNGAASERIFPGSGKTYIYIDEFVSIASMASGGEIGDVTTAVTGYVSFRGSWKRPNYFRTPFHGVLLEGGVLTSKYYAVTAEWGYSKAVPPLIKEVTVALSIRTFKQGEGAWSDSLSTGNFGQVLYRKMNQDLLFMLEQGGREFRTPAF